MSAEHAISDVDLMPNAVRHGLRMGSMLAASILPAAAFVVDQQVAKRRIWTRPNPQIIETTYDTNDTSGVGFLGIGGFNNHPSLNMEAYRPVLGEVGRVAILEDSQEELDTASYARTAVQWAKQNRLSAVGLVGFSTGAMVSVAMGPEMKSEGLELAFLFDSGLHCFDDVLGERRKKFLHILAYMDRRGLSGGTITRIAFEAVGHKVDNPDSKESFRSHFSHAIQKARLPTTPSTPQCLSRASLIESGNIDAHMPELQDSAFGFIGTEQEKGDTVVDNDQSYSHFQAAHKDTIARRYRRAPGHSNAADYPWESQTAMSDLLKDIGWSSTI